MWSINEQGKNIVSVKKKTAPITILASGGIFQVQKVVIIQWWLHISQFFSFISASFLPILFLFVRCFASPPRDVLDYQTSFRYLGLCISSYIYYCGPGVSQLAHHFFSPSLFQLQS